MTTSLGFDTVIVNNRMYDTESLSLLFNQLLKHDIKNYIFLSDFDFINNSFSLEADRIKKFKVLLKDITPYGVHTKICYNLNFEHDVSFNKELKRLYAYRKNSSLFISLPTMLDLKIYDSFSIDLNRLIYRLNAFPLCVDFDKVIETSNMDICMRLLKNPRIAFGFDLSYLFSPEKLDFLKTLIQNNSLVIPTISQDILQYEYLDYFYEKLLDNIGKEKYYQLCTKINKCSILFGF